jgi:hypothetical protein
MAHQRSPNCPQVTFVEAADRGRTLYQKEHTHPASREVVAQSLGYSGLNGRSLSMIGALRQYGILDGSGDELRISDDAVTYFELETGVERDSALERMLFNPPFFAQIHADFGDTLPSESNLKHYLIKQGFLPKTAEGVISVYRENILLIENKRSRYNESVNTQLDPTTINTNALVTNVPVKHMGTQGLTQQSDSQSYSLPLAKGTVADLRIRGDVTKKSLSLLRSQIELLIEALTEEAESEGE